MPSKQYLAAAHPTGGHVTQSEHHRRGRHVLLGVVVDQQVQTYLTKFIGVNHPAIVREIPHFYVFPAFPHFSQNVPNFWLYFEKQIFIQIVIIVGARKEFCS